MSKNGNRGFEELQWPVMCLWMWELYSIAAGFFVDDDFKNILEGCYSSPLKPQMAGPRRIKQALRPTLAFCILP